jgi:hypothetical protein
MRQDVGMPQPVDPDANAVVSKVGQCWRMIHDRQGQAAHCTTRTIVGATLGLSPERRASIYRARFACDGYLQPQ